MASDLLFEIGCEEIPAKMLARAIAELPALIEARLQTARLARGSVHAYGTPRRLAVVVRGLADRQPDLREDVTGPPVSAAFAPDGSLTKAGQGFAAKNGVAESALDKREVAGKKGLYVVATRNVVGEPTRTLLPAILRELAGAIPWPKAMRWGWSETTFVRPVQWLVALFGGEVVALDWAGHTAGRKTRGHRFLSSGWIDIASADRYVETLREVHVVVDPAERRDAIGKELARIERDTGLRVRPDPALLDEVTNLGEWPVAVAGEFDPSFLEVPEEIIVTAMRNHQRYFALEDAAGVLANRFVTLTATIVKDPKVVQRGNQTVIAARLSDAKFFFAEDRKHTFEQWNAKLDKVVFQAKLPEPCRTTGAKVRRIVEMVTALGPDIQTAAGSVHFRTGTAIEAARYCKSDLASAVVGEFPELQGTMGRHYADLRAMGSSIGSAIEQHYWPKGQGGELPVTAEGALVSLVDKIDTIYTCFAVGLMPTGSADPLGLRRAAIGAILILLDRGKSSGRATPGWPASTSNLVSLAANTFEKQGGAALSEAVGQQLRDFFRERLRSVLIGEGFATRHVDAVLKVSDAPADALGRAKAIAQVSDETIAVFRRLTNLLDQSSDVGIPYSGFVDARLFKTDIEREVWDLWKSKEPGILSALASRQWAAAFEGLAQMGPMLGRLLGDRASGGVMVLDQASPEVSGNRLSVLDNIVDHFKAIIDFRKLGGAA